MRSSSFPIRVGSVLISETDQTYAILQPLGSGGNASAYLCLATNGADAGSLFAAKIVFHTDESRRRAFRREIALLMRHSHPAILPVYDYGESQGHPFYISRYYAQTLESVIQENAASSFDRLLYATQLCSAVGFLSSVDPKIVHRDIKPSNVFVFGKTCVLGDFGMMTRLGRAEALPPPRAFRTPDLVTHLKGGPLATERSDVFQLGLVFCRLFTGRNPLNSGEPDAPVILSELPQVDGPLGEILNGVLPRMLSMDPRERVPIGELRTVLIGLTQNESRRGRQPFREGESSAPPASRT